MTTISKVLMAVGMAIVALGASAKAQSLPLTVNPVSITLTIRNTATATVTVSNMGTETATGVVVNVVPSKGLTVSMPANCTSTRSGISCTLDTVAPGASENIFLDFSAHKNGDYSVSYSLSCTSACNSSSTSTDILFK